MNVLLSMIQAAAGRWGLGLRLRLRLRGYLCGLDRGCPTLALDCSGFGVRGRQEDIYKRLRSLVLCLFDIDVSTEKINKIVDLQYLIKIHKFPERLLVHHGQIVRFNIA